MASSYPGALDALTNPTGTARMDTVPHAAQHANANDAIEAIEAELGTDPAGTFTTVKDRLDDQDWQLVAAAKPQGASATIGQLGVNPTATGTATTSSAPANTNAHTRMSRVDYLVTAATTTAVAGWRFTVATLQMSANAYTGGFKVKHRWGPATGVATSTTRSFTGLAAVTTAPTDVEPSTLVNVIGMGWDAADTNVQTMHNDGAGTCTKIDLGASFPVPSADRTDAYELTLTNEMGTSTVAYRVVNLSSGAVASGTLSTNLPATSTLLAPRGWISVGGTSSVIGYAFDRYLVYAKGL